jgi:hypothetical protein
VWGYENVTQSNVVLNPGDVEGMFTVSYEEIKETGKNIVPYIIVGLMFLLAIGNVLYGYMK